MHRKQLQESGAVFISGGLKRTDVVDNVLAARAGAATAAVPMPGNHPLDAFTGVYFRFALKEAQEPRKTRKTHIRSAYDLIREDRCGRHGSLYERIFPLRRVARIGI